MLACVCHSSVFTNPQDWQYCLYYQLGITIYFQFPSLFVPNDVGKYELDVCGYPSITFSGRPIHWSGSVLVAQLKQSWQYWHFCVEMRL